MWKFFTECCSDTDPLFLFLSLSHLGLWNLRAHRKLYPINDFQKEMKHFVDCRIFLLKLPFQIVIKKFGRETKIRFLRNFKNSEKCFLYLKNNSENEIEKLNVKRCYFEIKKSFESKQTYVFKFLHTP